MSMNDLLNRKELRDTTPNPPGEILRRVCALGMVAGLGLGGLLIFLAWAGRDEARLGAAYLCLAVGLVLLATRRWWRGGIGGGSQLINQAAPLETRPHAGRTGSAAIDRAATESSGGARPRVLLLNASLAGAQGNSARLLAEAGRLLAADADLVQAVLAGDGAVGFAELEPVLRECDALVIGTGTHWDSWSSPLQKFLEDATPSEASSLWLGKPVAVLVTEHSTGGKGVLSRLQGVLVTFGCALPPLSGLVVSQAVQLAGRYAPDPAAVEDFWSPADLEVVTHNLLATARTPKSCWRAWPVDRRGFRRTWLEVAPREK